MNIEIFLHKCCEMTVHVACKVDEPFQFDELPQNCELSNSGEPSYFGELGVTRQI